MAKKKIKPVVEETPVPVKKKESKKDIASLISTNDIVKGSFVIADNRLKLTVIDASGKKMNTVLPLDKNAVDMILS